MYLFVFSDDSLLKTGNTCNHSTPAQNPKSLYINREVQTNLNEANISNIIEENNTNLNMTKFILRKIQKMYCIILVCQAMVL